MFTNFGTLLGEESDLEIVTPSSSDSASSVHLEKSAEILKQQQAGEQSFKAASCQSNCDPSSRHPLFKSVYALGRQWCSFHRRCYHREGSRNFYFSVVSYNVLADGLLQSHNELYTGANDWVKNWDYRKRNLLKELLLYGADVSIIKLWKMYFSVPCHRQTRKKQIQVLPLGIKPLTLFLSS